MGDLLFTGYGVVVGDRSVERYDLVKTKLTVREGRFVGFSFSTFEVWYPNASITIIHHTFSVVRIHHYKHNIFYSTFGLLREH